MFGWFKKNPKKLRKIASLGLNTISCKQKDQSIIAWLLQLRCFQLNPNQCSSVTSCHLRLPRPDAPPFNFFATLAAASMPAVLPTEMWARFRLETGSGTRLLSGRGLPGITPGRRTGPPTASEQAPVDHGQFRWLSASSHNTTRSSCAGFYKQP